MGALKPRGTSGPIEAAKEGRAYVLRIPVEGEGGRVVIALDAGEARELGLMLAACE